ncbi:MAG TPA: hypothetical protein VMU54_07165 [Planctomycetota bacterium]|nr:hypothetical protein [Planctomycetota bacterium]
MMMVNVGGPAVRVLLAALWIATFAQAQQQGKELKPPADDPPMGKGKILFQEDFESTPVGKIPAGFTLQGAVGVVEDVSHGGKHSLRMDAATRGPRRITMKNEVLAALGGQHWGRLYFRVQLPAPECSSGVIHSTIVSATGISPLHKDPIEVELLDTILNTQQTFNYLYNVQPEKRPEFGKGSDLTFKYSEEWTLAEWFVDHATQTYRLFINGKEVKDLAFTKGAGNFVKSEIPAVFESMSFGWYNYQGAGKGFTAWIDDIAMAKDRLGARGVLPPARPKKP